MKNLTILSINVWHGLYARTFWRAERLESPESRDRRLRVLVESIRALDPDVLALQECFPQPAFGRAIAGTLGYEHVSRVSNAGVRLFGIGFPGGVKTGEGSSILARPGLGLRPLGQRALSGFGWTHGLLSLQPVPKRCALAAVVSVGGKPLVIVTAHVRYEFGVESDLARAWSDLTAAGRVSGEMPLAIGQAARAGMATRDAELVVLREWCRELEARGPVVIAADLNVDDETPSLRAFQEGLQLTSVLPAVGSQRRTWDPVTNPNVAPSAAYDFVDGRPKDAAALMVAQHDRWQQRPDHVLLGPTFARSDLLDARVALDQQREGVMPSDHYGILATLRLA
jgi:endonuclease/exonuclease/phosphatase family metal-dependent hydrolase